MTFRGLKKYLKRHECVWIIYRAMRNPVKEIKEWINYFSCTRQNRNLFWVLPKNQCQHKVLVVSFLGNMVSLFKPESILAKAMQIYKAEPMIVTTRGSWINRHYRRLGINSLIYFDDILDLVNDGIQSRESDDAMEGFKTQEELMGYQYQGINVGKLVTSTLIRQTRTGCLDLSDLDMRSKIRQALKKSVRCVLAARKIIDQYRPGALLFLEKGYSPYGEIYELALERNLNIVQWCGSHRESALTLKRYKSSNRDQHPASLSKKTWDHLKSVDPRKVRPYVEKELHDNYSQGKWFSEVGTQFYSKLTDKQSIIDKLQLDPKKKTAVIFSHLFWDATFFWGTDLFLSYREWFVETLKAACENKSVNWIVKMHPSNIVKLHRDRYKGEFAERTAIREEIGEIPSHVKILEPATEISTYSLYGVMDYCLTVRGTVGIEAAFFGIPVLTAGTGRYDRLGFTIDSSSRQEYLERIKSIHGIPALSKEQHDNAVRFAYGTFILRPFLLESMEFRYRNDALASLEVDYRLKTHEELLRAKDLRRFADWVLKSDDEDYLEADAEHGLGI